ncbi:MAG: 50S ribosomal protein L11 methyltransferase, partial [Pseudomonadales bacterium]
DYGCGSGILAVAAALLGASPVYATDTDPQAIAATEMNAARNGVDINAGLVDDLRLAPAHLVMANILAQPLARLADRLSSLVRPGGELVLSGIMVDQADWVKQAYRNLLAPAAEAELDGWMRLVFRKPQ